MRYELTDRDVYFDTEFQETSSSVETISIGLVRADGRTYYAELDDFDRDNAQPWQNEHVLPHLTGPIHGRDRIARDILEFAGDRPVFQAYNSATDWKCLIGLYGILPDRPAGWPAFCHDVRLIRFLMGDPIMPARNVHNALDDALWLAKETAPYLARLAR